MKSSSILWKTAKIGLVALALLATIVWCARFLLNKSAINSYNTSISKAPYDVIIVPGLPYDSANVNTLFKSRMLWAKSLYENGITKNIIFSGSAVHTPYVEALVMKTFADSLGIPSANIYSEENALHSTENVDYGIVLAQKLGFSKIAVATDPFQYFYLNRYVISNNIKVGMLPFSLDSMPFYSKAALPKINAQSAFVANFIPLKNRDH
jgi:vancomycin permeability regulator SanA